MNPIDQIASMHNANGGSTVSIATGPISHGYALSVFPELTQKIEGKEISPAVVGEYVARHADVLADPHAAIGTWFNPADGQTYLDVSTVVQDRAKAIEAGKRANQIAVFDLDSFNEIPTGGTGTPVALPEFSARIPYLLQ